jgi:hypothetical protein
VAGDTGVLVEELLIHSSLFDCEWSGGRAGLGGMDVGAGGRRMKGGEGVELSRTSEIGL